MIVAVRHENKFGPKVGFQKGTEVGKLMGGAVSSIRYLYKQYDETGGGNLLRKTIESALKVFKNNARKPIKDRPNFFKDISADCDFFGIEIDEDNFK